MGESISESSVGLELPFSPGRSSRLHQSPFCFEPAEPHLDKPCQGGGELSDTGPTGKSLSFPTPCPQVPVYLTVPRVTSDGRRMALRSCWVNNISHHGREVQPDNCYSKNYFRGLHQPQAAAMGPGLVPIYESLLFGALLSPKDTTRCLTRAIQNPGKFMPLPVE